MVIVIDVDSVCRTGASDAFEPTGIVAMSSRKRTAFRIPHPRCRVSRCLCVLPDRGLSPHYGTRLIFLYLRLGANFSDSWHLRKYQKPFQSVRSMQADAFRPFVRWSVKVGTVFIEG